MTQIIILYGPPGSGKGTQAKLLQDKYGYVFLDFGQNFRDFVKENLLSTSLDYQRANRVKSDLEAGRAILTEDFYYILKNKIESLLESKTPFIIDKPGSLEAEAKWLSRLLKSKKVSTKFFHIQTDLSGSLQRIAHRYYLPSSKNPYPSYEVALLDAKNNEKPFQRKEDESQAITKTRIENLYGQHDIILDIYRKEGYEIVELDGNLEITEVFKNLEKNLLKS
jgi:adenylate kinase